jgi:hypothetical protein
MNAWLLLVVSAIILHSNVMCYAGIRRETSHRRPRGCSPLEARFICDGQTVTRAGDIAVLFKYRHSQGVHKVNGVSST